jgi:hypothetical protein
MSDAVAIADAIVGLLNGASLSPAFTAARGYVLVGDLSTAAGLRVTVIPATLAVEAIDLKPRRAFDWEIAIAVQQRLPSARPENVDPLMLLVQRIIDLFVPGEYIADHLARLMGLTCVPVFDPERLDTQGMFTSIVTVVARVTR